MEGKVAVLGGSDFVMPFSTLGLDTFAVEENAEAVVESATKIIQGRYGLVVVAENIASFANVVFEQVDSKPLPAVVVVPFTTESKGFALQSLGKALKMATGIDIIN